MSGLELLPLTRELAVERRSLGSELPVIDVGFGRHQAIGDEVGYYIPAVGVVVETPETHEAAEAMP